MEKDTKVEVGRGRERERETGREKVRDNERDGKGNIRSIDRDIKMKEIFHT